MLSVMNWVLTHPDEPCNQTTVGQVHERFRICNASRGIFLLCPHVFLNWGACTARTSSFDFCSRLSKVRFKESHLRRKE